MITVIHNPFNPFRDREIIPHNEVRTIAETYNSISFQNPVICLKNGEAILRRRWETELIMKDDMISFISLPQGGGGGGGSNPLRIVLFVAVMVAAVYTGGAVGAAYGSFWGGMAGAAVSVAGGFLVNALMPMPKTHLPGSGYDSPSPTYALQAHGNQARLSSPIPVIYGRHIVYPDFAAMPYNEYRNNLQYVYQLHVIGQGYCEVESIFIEDTPISSFEEISYEILPPGTKTSMFEDDVIVATEIAGQELLGEYVGPFALNPAGTQASKIGVDMVLQRGCYYANDDGSLSGLTITWRVEACLIDDSGAEIGEWFVLGDEVISTANHNSIYKSYKYEVDPGRYFVRAIRTNGKNNSSRAGHEIRWGAARGYLDGDIDYGNLTMLAIVMRATDNLSQRSSRMVNCIVKRYLPVYDGKKWSEPQFTDSIAWILADVLKADYGAKLDDSRIDLEALFYLDKVWKERGDCFNGVFDSSTTIWEALNTVARCGRAMPFLQGGIVRFARDEPKHIPVALFTPRNIVKNSLTVQYLMPSEDTADSVTVEFYDENLWSANEITVSLNDSSSENTAKISLFGCTKQVQAEREGLYMAAANRYRRRILSFSTELEGLIPTYGDLIVVSHDMADWGQSGEVLSIHDGIVTVSEPLRWQDGKEHYVVIREKNGAPSDPIACKRVSENRLHLLSESNCEQSTEFAFGVINQWSIRARVLAIKPRSSQVEISAVIEDDRVHIN